MQCQESRNLRTTYYVREPFYTKKGLSTYLAEEMGVSEAYTAGELGHCRVRVNQREM